jgi:uncharacterized protein (TIGR04255 family)
MSGERFPARIHRAGKTIRIAEPILSEMEEAQVPFPESERVVYDRNTLEEVKCQVRFPAILAIDATAPAAFQEAVRAELPLYEMKSSVKLPAGVPQGIAQIVERDLSLVGTKSYAFSSEDRTITLALTKEGLSLTCRRYERWEPFRQYMERALAPLVTHYKPSFFTHVCVRYKNSIRRQPLGLQEGIPWSRLVRPWIGGPLNSPDTEGEVQGLLTKCVIGLPANVGSVEATFALGTQQPSGESAFIIEAHVYETSRKSADDVLPRLDSLHRHAGNFFRWCITDELHRAMRPSPT